MILIATLNPAVDFTVFGGRLNPYQTNRGTDVPPDPGGKGNNAARVARLLGCDVSVTGFAGGFTGQYVRARLREEGIKDCYYTTEKATRVTLSYIEEESRRETKIVPSGPELSSGEAEAFLRHFQYLLDSRPFSIIGLCGSLPRGVPDDYYGTLIDIAAGRHIPVILDTSGGSLSEGIKHRPSMIKPNREEAFELTGGSTMEEVTSRVKSMTVLVPTISLTLGGDGAVLFRHGLTMRGRSTIGPAVNPVGAGDAFIGGYMAAFSRFGDDPMSSFRWALAASACTARATGITWPPGEFDDALRTIELEELP